MADTPPATASPKAPISTKLYPPQSEAANKYKAHVLLTENRDITKEEAVNELIAIGAGSIFPGFLKNLFNKKGSKKKKP